MRKVIRQYLEQLKYSGINELFITNKANQLKSKQLEYKNCQKCPLNLGRMNFVYGEGNPDAICMVIGEAPGEQENLQGRPFVGPAGLLLDKMLFTINIRREEVNITNIVKCRPPGNRNPEQSERLACLPYLIEQIEILKPKLFLFMGLVAAQTLLDTNKPMHELREKHHTFMDITTFVTYHPSALLRNPNWKKPAWEDLQKFQIAYKAQLKKESINI